MIIETLMVKIKRQETPTAKLFYNLGRKVLRAELPAPKGLYQPLYYCGVAIDYLHRKGLSFFLHQPMFRSRCTSCGRNLMLDTGVPYITGDLHIHVGDNCIINGSNAFIAGKVFDAPTLIIEDGSFIGHGVEIVVAKKVSIGKHALIAGGCFITDNPGHPMDATRRRTEPVERERVRPVVIEDDVWLGLRCIVLPGTVIGTGSVIGAGSVVSGVLPPFSLAVGNPAQIIRNIKDEDRNQLISVVEKTQPFSEDDKTTTETPAGRKRR